MFRRFPGWLMLTIFLGLFGLSLLLAFVTKHHHPDGSTPPESSTAYDPYVCEREGRNGCWSPSIIQEGPPYMGFSTPRPPQDKTCSVTGLNDPAQDDAPAIVKAFQDCSENGHIIFENSTYYIASVLNTTGLRNVDIEIQGTLKWNNSNIAYWRNHSLPIGFQNQTSAWHLGGEQIHFYGHGYGTLDGHGQVWYDFAHGKSNLHGRPHMLTIINTKDSVIEGLNFYKTQMWTMTVIRSEQVLLQDINVDNQCDVVYRACNANTDGIDTVYANNITMLRWNVHNGDDGFSAKQNSTNIYYADSILQSYACFAMGSIGQYPGQIEIIENITATNITCKESKYGVFVKSWTGEAKGEPPNGGGGGIGFAKNMTFANMTLDRVYYAYHFEQNTSYNGLKGGKGSPFHISDVTLGPTKGTLVTATVADISCSDAAPCSNITVVDTHVSHVNGSTIDEYLCHNVVDGDGFTCKGGGLGTSSKHHRAGRRNHEREA